MIALNLTSIGASHIRSGKECQDFSLCDTNERYCYAITCDGHGGDNYFRSALGSRFAAQAASSCITEFLNDVIGGYKPEDPESMLVQLEKSIIARWNASVWEHYESNPFTEAELNSVDEKRRKRILAGKSIESTYGTTLIALAVSGDFWFGIQIGDGKCVRVQQDGSFDMPIPPNEKCFLNSTTSICDENAIEDFRHCYSEQSPVALFCGSDGIDDSFITDAQLYKLYATIARSFATSEYSKAHAELEDYMPRLSFKGSGDDVSIAGLIDISRVIEAIGEADEFDDSSDIVSGEGTDAKGAMRVWECPNCGNICATNFCGECGAKKPEYSVQAEDGPSSEDVTTLTVDDIVRTNESAAIGKSKHGVNPDSVANPIDVRSEGEGDLESDLAEGVNPEEPIAISQAFEDSVIRNPIEESNDAAVEAEEADGQGDDEVILAAECIEGQKSATSNGESALARELEGHTETEAVNDGDAGKK